MLIKHLQNSLFSEREPDVRNLRSEMAFPTQVDGQTGQAAPHRRMYFEPPALHRAFGVIAVPPNEKDGNVVD